MAGSSTIYLVLGIRHFAPECDRRPGGQIILLEHMRAEKPLLSWLMERKNRMINDRPFVTLNVALTADGKTDTVARRGATISSPQDLTRVDRLRAESDAVLVGGRTLLGDDPRLTVKSADLRAERRARGLEENPIKVGIVSNADLRLDSRFLTAGPAQVMLFTTQRTGPAQIIRLRERGAQVFVMGERRVDLVATFHRLREHGVKRLLVDGGGTLNAE